jgi:hypothetical protein
MIKPRRIIVPLNDNSLRRIISIRPGQGIDHSTRANEGGQFIKRFYFAIRVAGQPFFALAVAIAPNDLHSEG